MYPKIQNRLKEMHTTELKVAYTTDEANKWIDEQTEESLKGKRVLLHVGSNDIKENSTAEKTANKLHRVTKKLYEMKCDFMVCQIPPLYIEDELDPMKYSRQQIIFNTMITERYENRAIKTDLEGDRSNIREDNIHLTDLAAENTAEIVAEEIKRPISKQVVHTHPKDARKRSHEETDEEVEYTQSITTDPARAAKIIGQDGYRIRKLKARRHVAIDTEYIDEDRNFIVKGTKENVKATIGEIENLITSTVRADIEAKQPPRKTAVCRYYNTPQGCRFGNRCHFLHTRDRPLDLSPRTSEEERNSSQRSHQPRSRERSPTDKRNRSPSDRRDRSPLDRRDKSPRPKSPMRPRRDSRNEPPPTRHWEQRKVWSSETKKNVYPQGSKGNSWYSMEPRSYHPSQAQASKPK